MFGRKKGKRRASRADREAAASEVRWRGAKREQRILGQETRAVQQDDQVLLNTVILTDAMMSTGDGQDARDSDGQDGGSGQDPDPGTGPDDGGSSDSGSYDGGSSSYDGGSSSYDSGSSGGFDGGSSSFDGGSY